MNKVISVIGAGAFGTALAAVLAREGRHKINLLGRSPTQLKNIGGSRVNAQSLPNSPLPVELRYTTSPEALLESHCVLFAIPAQAHASAAAEYQSYITERALVVTCAKGIDRVSSELLSSVLQQTLPSNEVAALSGPGFAVDLVQGLPTAMAIASSQTTATYLAKLLSTSTFRLYASSDAIGVQLGGAIKNVLAIACGIGEGAGLGDSARAAVISRGLAEMSRLIVAMGGKAETARGLSGLGDLVLTGTSMQSRNYRYGIDIGKRVLPNEMCHALIEGASTAPVAARLGRENGVDLPIISSVADILAGNISVREAIHSLMNRPITKEH